MPKLKPTCPRKTKNTWSPWSQSGIMTFSRSWIERSSKVTGRSARNWNLGLVDFCAFRKILRETNLREKQQKAMSPSVRT